MGSLFAFTLTAHIVMGVVAVIATFLVLLNLLKDEPSIKRMRDMSLLASLGYFLSWFSGGYYYWFWYGGNVKPIIKEGDYAWAHLVVMEAKEHIFLLLPIMSLVTLGFTYMSGKRLMLDSEFKSAVTYFVAVSFALAVLITLSGIIISGGAR